MRKKRLSARRNVSVVLILLGMIIAVTRPVSATPIHGIQVLNVSPNQWDGAHLFRPWVIYDGSSFTMWYGGEDSQRVDRIGMAKSADGISWTKYGGNPVLDLGPRGSWDSDSISDACVVKENGEYKMWYTGQKYSATVSSDVWEIGYATSLDGIHWTKYPENPVLMTGSTGAWDDFRVWRPSVISTESGYVMYYRGATHVEGAQARAGVAISSDGIHWSKTTVLTPPPGDTGWDAYSRKVGALNIGGVMRSGNTYIMSYASIKVEDGPAQIGLAISEDGTEWTPYADNPVVTYGSAGWDSGPGGVGAGSFAGSMILAARDQYFVYYGASGTRSYTIGLATLSMDTYQIPEYSSTPLVILVAFLAPLALLALRKPRRPQLRSCSLMVH